MKIPRTKDIGAPIKTRKPHPAKVWLPVDDEVIRTEYALHGSDYCAKKLGRSRGACINRASQLKVKLIARLGGRKRSPGAQESLKLAKPFKDHLRVFLAVGEWEGKVGNLPARSVFELARGLCAELGEAL